MRPQFETLLRSGKLHQFQMAELALTRAGIPHNLQEESVSGFVAAMPIDPSPEPGTWWAILVPTDPLEAAQEVIAELPFEFTTTPSVWDCSPSPRGRKILPIMIWLHIAFFIVMCIAIFLKN